MFHSINQNFIRYLSKQANIDFDIVQKYYQEALEKDENFRTFLIQQQAIPQEQYQKILAEYLNVPYIEKFNDVSNELMEVVTQKITYKYAAKYQFFPFKIQDASIHLAVVEPFMLHLYESIASKFNKQLVLHLTLPETISQALQSVYNRSGSTTEDAVEAFEDDKSFQELTELGFEEEDLLSAENEEPIRKLANSLLFQAVRSRASDIHIDASTSFTNVRMRIDGELQNTIQVPVYGHKPLINRIKVMAGLDISTRNIPQDGRTMIKIGGTKIDLRVSILPTINGERVVLRILNQGEGILDLSKLGLTTYMKSILVKLIQQPHGIILVTGPTGSGKTTTLYSAMGTIDSATRNVITIEDPVEYQQSSYGQVQVNEKVGLTFASGLRTILRQDPDVIMIGEIRDRETAQIAIQASLTGHLVLSTLHTNDAPSATMRLIDMGIDVFLINSTLTAVLAQRLIRKICEHCKTSYKVSKKFLLEIGFPIEVLKNFSGKLYSGSKCDKCFQTGYSGRIGVYELMLMSNKLRAEISQNTNSSAIKDIAVEQGMKTLKYDCAEKIMQGLTTTEEFIRLVSIEETGVSNS